MVHGGKATSLHFKCNVVPPKSIVGELFAVGSIFRVPGHRNANGILDAMTNSNSAVSDTQESNIGSTEGDGNTEGDGDSAGNGGGVMTAGDGVGGTVEGERVAGVVVGVLVVTTLLLLFVELSVELPG